MESSRWELDGCFFPSPRFFLCQLLQISPHCFGKYLQIPRTCYFSLLLIGYCAFALFDSTPDVVLQEPLAHLLVRDTTFWQPQNLNKFTE
jgi:hypothetical protein